MPRRLSAAEILRTIPPHRRAALRQLGVDLDDPEMARLFIDGVRAAEELIAKESASDAAPRDRRHGRGERHERPGVRSQKSAN